MVNRLLEPRKRYEGGTANQSQSYEGTAMKYGLTVSLAGLVFEIFGSLVLAIEVIGLERVDPLA